MSISLRILLIAGALSILAFVLNKIRKQQLYTSDAVFWFLLSAAFVILAIFPQIAYALSWILGIDSPANFVFLIVIAILMFKALLMTAQISMLKLRLSRFVEHEALRENRERTR